jgi:hypothetical protein
MPVLPWSKKWQERITTVCVNSDGNDKWMPIVVGKSLKLHCFKNTKKLPVERYTNKKAWINTAIFIGF